MRYSLTAVIALASVAIIMPAAAATFDFYETGISCAFASCSLPPPAVLMSLTLSTATESGSAIWYGSGAPAVTDPGFAFQSPGSSLELDIGAPNFTNCGGFAEDGCKYQILWNEVDGTLTALSIFVLGTTESIGDPVGGFGLAGGEIGADGVFGGCVFGVCDVTGSWQVVADPVPEPSSAMLLLAGLLGLSCIGIGRETTHDRSKVPLRTWIR